MGSSAVLRRGWISGILRSRADASSNCSPYRQLVANRSGSKRWISAAAPWLMLEAHYCDWEGEWTYRFHSCAEARSYSFVLNRRGECVRPNMLGANVVGSSHGWVALHYMRTNVLYLSDPTIFAIIHLPPVCSTTRIRSLILDRRDGNAFMISGSGLAFCSPGRSAQWTPLGDRGDYESVVYSSLHRRLFCLTSAFQLEAWAWDAALEQPTLQRAIPFEGPEPELELRELTRVLYLVCAEEELFVVVRSLKSESGFWDDNLDRYVTPTVGFKVYKMDMDRGRLLKMEDSLEGLTMFVGTNHPVALKHVRGLRPNSIYFAYEKCGRYDKFDARDIGIFDYHEGLIHPISISHPLNYALWFTPAI